MNSLNSKEAKKRLVNKELEMQKISFFQGFILIKATELEKNFVIRLLVLPKK